MSDGDDSIAMSIEDAFAQTLADMEEAREELASAPIESESPSLDSAFEVGVSEVSEEVPELSSPMAPPPSPPSIVETPAPQMDVLLSPSSAGPPAGPPMMGPPMGGPPAGPPMMGPPMGGPPAGPPMMGPPMGGPPASPPMNASPVSSPKMRPAPPMEVPPSSPPMAPSPILAEDEGSTFQVADLSEITNDIQTEETISTEVESNVEFDESVVVEESLDTGEVESPEVTIDPEFNPVDAEDFMSDFQDDWDESAPLRASDVDRTEGMDW